MTGKQNMLYLFSIMKTSIPVMKHNEIFKLKQIYQPRKRTVNVTLMQKTPCAVRKVH